MTAPQAALLALTELFRTLVPNTRPPEDIAGVVGFVRHLRDTLEVS